MSDQDHSDAPEDQPEPDKKRLKARRRMLSAAGIVTTDSLLEWHRPVVEHVIMPAHAQSSPAAPSPDSTMEPTPSPTDSGSQAPTPEPTTGPTPNPTPDPTPQPTDE